MKLLEQAYRFNHILKNHVVPFSSSVNPAIVGGGKMFSTFTPQGKGDAMKAVIEGLKKEIPHEDDPQAKKVHETPWRGGVSGVASALFFPKTTEQIQTIVKACYAHQWPIIPQGGNTGVVYGSTPRAQFLPSSIHAGKQPILINTKHLNSIGNVGAITNTVTVGSGVILQTLREKMDQKDLLFAGGKMGSEGSANIGGATATNAGGANYLRYGGMREQVLGIRAVLPDGRLLDTISNVEKDNTGFNLTPLFVGAEGTLGLITEVKLRLHALPKQVETALVSVDNVAQAIELLKQLKELYPEELSAFELMSAPAFDMVTDAMDSGSPFGEERYPFYVLVELSSSKTAEILPLNDQLIDAIGNAAEEGMVSNAVFGKPEELWRIRESITEKASHKGLVIPNDVSLPVDRIAEYLNASEGVLQKEFVDLGLQRFSFGHLGDGNLHDNFLQLDNTKEPLTAERQKAFEQRIGQIVIEYGGSPVAEHGIGHKNMKVFEQYKNPVTLDMMYGIKRLLDPQNIMNPGVLFSEDRLLQKEERSL